MNTLQVTRSGPSRPITTHRRRRQGQLLAFSMSGALALALSACSKTTPDEVMIAPPNDFKPEQAATVYSTNAPPTGPYVYSTPANGGYLGHCGYYHIYGYPNYYYRPAPGTTVELVTGGSETYSAGSVTAAHENIERGGFGESGEGHGFGEGGHGGGE